MTAYRVIEPVLNEVFRASTISVRLRCIRGTSRRALKKKKNDRPATCYRPAVAFIHIRLTALSISKGTIREAFQKCYDLTVLNI
jgi:hypothetical protein